MCPDGGKKLTRKESEFGVYWGCDGCGGYSVSNRPGNAHESGSKLHALQTLRDSSHSQKILAACEQFGLLNCEKRTTIHFPFPIQNKCLSPRRNICPSLMAGEAYAFSPSSFCATRIRYGP